MTPRFPVPSPPRFLHEILDLPVEIIPYSALHNASYALFKCQQLTSALILQNKLILECTCLNAKTVMTFMTCHSITIIC